MAGDRSVDLQYPLGGIVRRAGYSVPVGRPPFPTPWAVNVRPQDPFVSRLRGGSRPGLTLYSDANLGGSVSALLSVPIADSSGAETVLAYFSSGTLGTVDPTYISSDSSPSPASGSSVGSLSSVSGVSASSSASVPGGTELDAGLLTEAGEGITTEGGDAITAGTGSAPSSCSLAVRGKVLFGVATTGITSLNLSTGQIDAVTASAGTVPTGNIACFYRDRLVVIGSDNIIYLSRQGDPTDWDYGDVLDDSGRAVALQLSEASEIGVVPTAVIAHKDAALLIGTTYGLWVLEGDPASSGSLRCVSRSVGIHSSTAWCKVDDDIVFLAADGLYKVAPNGDGLESLTDERIPSDLTGIPSTTRVRLGYSHTEKGVYIFLKDVSSVRSQWFFSIDPAGFWRDEYDTDHFPLALCQHQGKLVLCGEDGYLRYVGGTDDDAVSIESHVVLGPIPGISSESHGRLLSLIGTTATGSGTVYWRIVTGISAQSAADQAKAAIEKYQTGGDYTADVAATGTLTAGRNHISYPRIRAAWFCIWLESTARWAFERMALEFVQSGRLR